MVREIIQSSPRISIVPRGVKQTQEGAEYTDTLPRGRAESIRQHTPRGRWTAIKKQRAADIAEYERQLAQYEKDKAEYEKQLALYELEQGEYEKAMAQYEAEVSKLRPQEYKKLSDLTKYDEQQKKYIPVDANNYNVEYYPDGTIKTVKSKPVQYYKTVTKTGSSGLTSYSPEIYEFDKDGKLVKYLRQEKYKPTYKKDNKYKLKKYGTYVAKEINFYKDTGIAQDIKTFQPIDDYSGYSGSGDKKYLKEEKIVPYTVIKNNPGGQRIYYERETYDDTKNDPDEKIETWEKIDYITGEYKYRDYEAKREYRKQLAEYEKLTKDFSIDTPISPFTPKTFISKDPTKPYYGQQVLQTKGGAIKPVEEVDWSYLDKLYAPQTSKKDTVTKVEATSSPVLAQAPKLTAQLTSIKPQVIITPKISIPSQVVQTATQTPNLSKTSLQFGSNLLKQTKVSDTTKLNLSNIMPSVEIPKFNMPTTMFGNTAQKLTENTSNIFKSFENKVAGFLGKKI